MIKKFVVKGLNGDIDHDLDFHNDLNILTGRNGSGKTSLLKLMWYMYSGNIERTYREIQFTRAELVSDRYTVSVDLDFIDPNNESNDVQILYVRHQLDSNDERKATSEMLFPKSEWDSPNINIDVINRKVIDGSNASLFFPTFRRIEGGFDTVSKFSLHSNSRWSGTANSLREALEVYVDNISVYSHRFVATVSTDDIEQLLTKRFADISEETNRLHNELSHYIIGTIDKLDLGDATKDQRKVLQSIDKQVKKIDKRREELMAPFSVLNDLITTLFKHKGIALTKNVSFGETKNAISSEKLSAGEKQMLSFLCYNAFLSKGVIVIDEPEISLHTDWQRILFPTLLRQSQGNQFIVASHSPMIYSKYPEKEIILNADRGDEC